MKVDREAVNAQAAQFRKRRQAGVAALVSSIHRVPPLRDWVTLESVALPPVPQHVTARDGSQGWTLWSLVAFARRDTEQRVLRVRPAWGLVQWQWPNGRVLRHTRLKDLPQAQEALSQAGGEGDWDMSMQAEGLAARARFFEELTRFVSEPQRRDVARLTAGYAQVLPPGAVRVYRALVPGAAAWLAVPGNGAARESRPRSDGGAAAEEPPGQVRPSGVKAPGPDSGRPSPGGDCGPQQTAGASGSASAGGDGATSLVKTRGTALAMRIGEARRLATEFGLEQACAELDRLRERLRRPGFRVAVVGEFGRGKSTLVNRVLGRTVVPEGRHTPVPVVVAPGPEDALLLQFSDGSTLGRPLTESAWQDLPLTLDDEGPRLVGVRALVADAELARLDMEIVDTPGVNAGGEVRSASAGEKSDPASTSQAVAEDGADLIRRTVAASDAVVMVVSAGAPLGLSETSFLEEEVIARHVPRITLVASKLDTVDEEEREDIVDYLAGRVRRISAQLEVLAGPHREDGEPVEAVRERLRAYTADGGRRTMRARQTAGQLLTVLHEMAGAAREGAAAVRMDAQERRRVQEAAQAEIDGMSGTWGMVRVELQKRRSDTAEKFREHLRGAQEELVASLRYEIERAPEPRIWWERDLPFRLRRELAGMAKKYEAQLHASVSADIAWLDARMQEHFGSAGALRTPKVEQLSTEFELGEAQSLGLRDLKSRKLAWRLGPTGVAVLGMLLIPLTGGISAMPAGVGMAASAGGMVLGEVKSTSLTDRQRRQAVAALEPAVDRLLGEFARQVADRLDDLYTSVMAEAVRGQQAWRRDRQAALAAAAETGGPAWQDLLSRTAALTDRVGALLDAPGGAEAAGGAF